MTSCELGIRAVERDPGAKRFSLSCVLGAAHVDLIFSYATVKQFALDLASAPDQCHFQVAKRQAAGSGESDPDSVAAARTGASPDRLVGAVIDFLVGLGHQDQANAPATGAPERPAPQQRENCARFLTWARRAVSLFAPRDRRILAGLRTQLARRSARIPAFRLLPSDQGWAFRLRPATKVAFDIVLPLSPDEFVFVFRQWWRAAEEEMRTIIEDLWKPLHADATGLTPAQKERLATCFIVALKQDEFSHLRRNENLSWHYCYWHKLRWQAAQRVVADDRAEGAAVEWLSLCCRAEPAEPAMVGQIDPENEVAEVLFSAGAGPRREPHAERESGLDGAEAGRESRTPEQARSGGIPHFLERREREKQTLLRLAQWFARRYDLVTAFRILGVSYSRSMVGLSLAVVISILLIIILAETQATTVCSPIVLSLCVSIALLALVLWPWWRARRVARLGLRLIGGCVIGWLALGVDETWELALRDPRDHALMNWLPLLLLGAVLIYVVVEARRYLPSQVVPWPKLLRRALQVVALGCVISAMIGVLGCTISGPAHYRVLAEMIGARANSVELGLAMVQQPAPLLRWCQAVHMVEPGIVFALAVLIVHTPLALFVGLFVQIVWEDKPLTEAL